LHGYLETLLMKGSELSLDKQREYLETAARSSLRLSKLVVELFELAKLESRAAPLELEAFSLGDLMQDVAEEFALVAEQNGVRLRTRIDGNLEPVSGDIEMIERVLQNLLQNAINHTRAGGEVTLEAAQGPQTIAVSVTDTGCGMTPEVRERIFDAFFTTKPPGEGTGLGLDIVRKIIEKHGGQIFVESEVDRGSTFTVSLPIAGVA